MGFFAEKLLDFGLRDYKSRKLDQPQATSSLMAFVDVIKAIK